MTSVERLCYEGKCTLLHACTKCHVEQSCDQYYRRKSSGNDARDRTGERIARCKACSTKARGQWRQSNPGRVKDTLLKWKYQVSAERFAELLATQGGVCALCCTDSPGGKGEWAVDHDHSCCPGPRSCGMCVRGLLCTFCNMGLGLFKDNPDTLRRAADYVGKQL